MAEAREGGLAPGVFHGPRVAGERPAVWRRHPAAGAPGALRGSQRQAAPQVSVPVVSVHGHVQPGIGVGAVAVAAPQGAEHHVAAFDGALVLDLQMDGVVVDLQRALVIEGLLTCGTEHPAFLCAQAVPLGLHFGLWGQLCPFKLRDYAV